MPSDTNSALLGLLMMATGNDNNSWGDNLNNFVFAYLESAIAGYTSITTTGGPLSVTAVQERAGIWEFDGVLASNLTVTIDNVSKRKRIFNNTTGAFVLHVQTATGNPVEIPQGTHKDIVCDGNNHVYRMDADQVGRLIHHAGTTAPNGTLVCDGSTFVRADHVDLFNAIGTTWGTGNGATTATLPKLTDTNRFLRAADGVNVTVGTYQANQNAAHTHAVTGAPSAGTLGTDSQGAHTHAVTDPGHVHGGAQANIQTGNPSGWPNNVGSDVWAGAPQNTSSAVTGISIQSAGTHTHNITGAPGLGTLATASAGGTEGRPESAAVLICITL